jgi:hypothetical protein
MDAMPILLARYGYVTANANSSLIECRSKAAVSDRPAGKTAGLNGVDAGQRRRSNGCENRGR